MRQVCLALVVMFALGSCSDGSTAPDAGGYGTIAVTALSSDPRVSTVEAAVTAKDLSSVLRFQLGRVADSAFAELRLPAGELRTIVIRGLDSGGNVRSIAVATVNIRRTPNPPIRVTLERHTGPAAAIRITPSPISMGLGDSLQLVALMHDALGDTVASFVTWSSSDAAIVYANPMGLVVGRSAGDALVRAASDAATADIAVRVVGMATPRGLLASSNTTGPVILTWTSDGPASSWLALERSVGGGEFALVAQLTPESQRYDDPRAGVAEDTRYRIRSCEELGCTLWSAVATAIWDTTRAPHGLVASIEPGTYVVRLQWQPGSDGFRERLQRREATGDWRAIATGSPGMVVMTATDSSFPVDRSSTFEYRVVACDLDACSESSASDPVTTSVLLPPQFTWALPTWGFPVPQLITVDLQWDDQSVGEDHFELEMKTEGAGLYPSYSYSDWRFMGRFPANATSGTFGFSNPYTCGGQATIRMYAVTADGRRSVASAERKVVIPALRFSPPPGWPRDERWC